MSGHNGASGNLQKPAIGGSNRASSNGHVDFHMLPEGEPRWKFFGASVGMQFVALMALVWVPLLLPQKIVFHTHYSVIPLLETKPVSEWKPQPKPHFKVPPPEPEKIIAPKPRPEIEARLNKAPMIAPHFQPINPEAPVPPRPRPEIKTGLLGGGSSAPATVNRPAREVQTGGFGDPNGVPAVGNGKRAATIARLGSFDLPPGPGYGNGSGGAKGVRGTVASAGFGNGIAIQGSGGPGGSGNPGSVKQGVFSDAKQPVETTRKSTPAETPSVQPLEIVSKPDPAYTAEARQQKIEGEVLLQVVFTATGQVQVLRVVRGLGHGLDETAQAAARQIRFKPQRVNGQPVDSTATVHIVFQLAY